MSKKSGSISIPNTDAGNSGVSKSLKLSSGDSGSMILNTDTSVFDVRESMNKLVDHEMAKLVYM